MIRSFITRSTEETEALGASLARLASPGFLVLLEGGLGAGKTTFVRGFVNELGGRGVKSPSFTLINEYQGSIPVAHADLYRLEGVDFRSIGLEEYLDDGWVVIIEWPERLVSIPRFDGITVKLERHSLPDLSEGNRKLEIDPVGLEVESKLELLDFCGLEELL